MKIEYYNFHNILKMKIIFINPKLFDSYLGKIFGYYKVPNIETADLIIKIGKFSPNLKDCRIVDGKYYVKKDFIYYQTKYKMAWWETEINGIEQDVTNVKINSNIWGKMVYPGETIYNLIRFKLANKGFSMLHAAGIGKNGMVYIFSGRSGAGKTLSLINFLRKGFDYYSDDSVILGKGEIYGFVIPLNLRFTYDVESLLGIKFSFKKRIEIFIKKIIQLLSFKYINLFTNLEIKEVFHKAIKNNGNLKSVYLLINAPKFEIKHNISRLCATKQLFLNIFFESIELKKWLLAYCFCNPQSSLNGYWENLINIIYFNLSQITCNRVELPKKYTNMVFQKLYEELVRQ